ncbi:MAG: YibE/F family protein [Acidimicrobiia bacterium]
MSDLERLAGPDSRLGMGWVPLVAAVVLGIALVATWPRGDALPDTGGLGLADELHRAEVTRVVDGPCSFDDTDACRTVVFLLEEGPRVGRDYVQEFTATASTPDLREGDAVVLAWVEGAQPDFEYQYSDRERRGVLIGVFLAFAVAVGALGRLRGLAALAGLMLSVVVVVAYIVPAIAAGSSAVLISIVGSGTVALLALYLAHGFRPLTHVAFVGTILALGVTFGLAALVLELARFSGFSSEESLYLAVAGNVDIRGLLLAGVVLGALGALDDVTVTQASAVWELRKAQPDMSVAELAQAGLRIGRDHIASTVNTLLLAYAGASMPLLLLFSLSGLRLADVANSEVVAVEIVRTLVGSIGLVLAVPLTTYLAAAIATRSEAGK